MTAYEDYRQSLPTIKISAFTRWQKLVVRMNRGWFGKMIMNINWFFCE